LMYSRRCDVRRHASSRQPWWALGGPQPNRETCPASNARDLAVVCLRRPNARIAHRRGTAAPCPAILRYQRGGRPHRPDERPHHRAEWRLDRGRSFNLPFHSGGTPRQPISNPGALTPSESAIVLWNGQPDRTEGKRLYVILRKIASACGPCIWHQSWLF